MTLLKDNMGYCIPFPENMVEIYGLNHTREFVQAATSHPEPLMLIVFVDGKPSDSTKNGKSLRISGSDFIKPLKRSITNVLQQHQKTHKRRE